MSDYLPREDGESLARAFEEFKASHDDQIKELKNGQGDPLTEEKLTKISDSIDDLVEAKAALETKLAAETKEREELEARLNRKQANPGNGETSAELKSFNTMLASLAAQKSESFEPLDADGFKAYGENFTRYLRKGDAAFLDTERKAMSVGSDPDGGYFVMPDTSGRIVKKIFESSPMRQFANVMTISTDALEGIEDLNEAGVGWVAETGSRSDTSTPQVGKWRIEAEEMYASPKATQKMLDDSTVNIESWLADKVADRLSRLEATAFITGNGIGKPRGLLDYTTAATADATRAWGVIEHIETGVNGGFAASNPSDILFDLIYAHKVAYLGNARWMTRREIIKLIRKFKGSDNNYLWAPGLQMGEPESLAGYPVVRAEDMDALATGSLSLAFGDFGTAYQIVDRQGSRVLRDPFTDKPYVKFYTTRRVGGGVVNTEAVKLIKFTA